jgi:hypothetical protein
MSSAADKRANSWSFRFSFAKLEITLKIRSMRSLHSETNNYKRVKYKYKNSQTKASTSIKIFLGHGMRPFKEISSRSQNVVGDFISEVNY